jgi:predicted nucleotidyltransferase component of viral defense system
LKEICYSDIGQDYLFKGGGCLVKCYFGYYRFSVDLDFYKSFQINAYDEKEILCGKVRAVLTRKS